MMRLHQDAFLMKPISILISPIYIIRRGLYKSILKLAPKIKGDVLDLGCGSKPYESIFINANKYVGVDLEISGHNHFDSKVDYFYDGITIPFPDNSFDSVVCFETFEHIFNLNEVFTEISRVTRPGGLLLVSAPFVWEEHEIPYDFARYSSYGLAHIINGHSYNILDSMKTTTYVLTVGQLFINYIAQYVLPRGRVLGKIFQILVIFPLNLIVLSINLILPKKYSLFCNNLMLCQNHKSQQ